MYIFSFGGEVFTKKKIYLLAYLIDFDLLSLTPTFSCTSNNSNKLLAKTLSA